MQSQPTSHSIRCTLQSRLSIALSLKNVMILRNAVLQRSKKPVQRYCAGSRRALLTFEASLCLARRPRSVTLGRNSPPIFSKSGKISHCADSLMAHYTAAVQRLFAIRPLCIPVAAVVAVLPAVGRDAAITEGQAGCTCDLAGRQPTAALLRILGRRKLRFGPDQLQLVVVVYRNPCGTAGDDLAGPGRRGLCYVMSTMGARTDAGRADAGYYLSL